MQSAKKFTNNLINESSPYLLQHAHNPVEWFGWNPNAFEKAKAEDKPILLSIGYSACHWCHVMEHESFENEKIAKIMNENFVNIKVDMEERPDVDKIYMNFVQLTTGGGGWPLTVFMTPDQLPFFGGTYFPPEPRYNMPSFEQILISVSDAYRSRRDEVLHSANDLLGELQRIGHVETSGETPSDELLNTAFETLARTFDSVNGGFGGAPKFPAPMAMEFLLRYYHRTNNENALKMVEFSCRKMAEGGIFDQIGGGFHRYTVDAVWLTPHFEKMLYDNAQLVRIYLHLYQITKDGFYKRIAVETLEYVKREMLDPDGGFYSAQDADSEGVEGKFFVWTAEEVRSILGAPDAEYFNFHYGVSDSGNFEGKNILNVRNSIVESAAKFGVSEEELRTSLEAGRKKLFADREKRIKPLRDEKILTAWNGMMLAAFAEAAAILGSDEYLKIATNNAEFVIENLQKDGLLLRTSKDGKSKLNAYIEDYANFADGLFELFQASGEIKYLLESKRLAGIMIAEFWDDEAGGFYFTSKSHEKLLIRSKDFYDNATPSGNSVAADVLTKLARVFGEDEYQAYAVAVFRLVTNQIRRHPGAFGRALSALEFNHGTVKEIVIAGERGSELEREIWASYLPFKVALPTHDPGKDAEFVPLFKGRMTIAGKPTVYVCENFTCRRPVTSVTELIEELG